ncbi:hypothetical protein ACFLYF_06825, partial [Chloroflexota bacterium]
MNIHHFKDKENRNIYVSIAHHYVVPERVRTGLQVLLENGRGARVWPGYYRHFTMTARDNPLKITAIWLWKYKDEYNYWTNSPAHIRGGHYNLWSKPTEALPYEVVQEQWSPANRDFMVNWHNIGRSNIVVYITDYYINSDRHEVAKHALMDYGKGTMVWAGFFYYLVLQSLENPLKMTSVGIWSNESEYELMHSKHASLIMEDNQLWSQP